MPPPLPEMSPPHYRMGTQVAGPGKTHPSAI